MAGAARFAAAMLVCALIAGGATAQAPTPPYPIEPGGPQATVTLAADGRIFVGSVRTADDEIEDKLLEIVNRDAPIRLLADKRIRYDRLMRVMDILRRGGFTHVALVAWDGR